jgi:uncharacterized protein (DUF4415 family)
MAHKKRVTKTRKQAASGKSANRGKRRKSLSLSASVESSKRPVTLRLDADVLAWFRRDGRRYQTRINSALRSMMEREIKKG